MTYKQEDLNYLKEIFYKIEKLENANEADLNKSLNLFYGFEASNNVLWKNEFKEAIRKKGAISKNGKQKYHEIDANAFNKIEGKTIMEMAFKKKSDIKEKLISLYKDKNFKSTIIYEAPPYLLSIKEQNRTTNTEFIAEFILDNKCSSPYSNAIRGCFNDQNSTINEILKNNDCGFFDVIPMPLPINSDLRNK